MSHRTLAVGLAVLVTVLLTASMLFALSPASTHTVVPTASASSGGIAAARPAAAIEATIVNGYDVPTTQFYPGAVGLGSLYFVVYDPVDHAVNVTITDPNATRDGVPTPAFSYMATLNTTTDTFNSYAKGVSYAFPATIPYAGQWTVTFSAPSGGSVSQNVSLHLYHTSLSTTVGTSATLPAQAIGVFWMLNEASNDATLYTRATNVTIRGIYESNGNTLSLFASGSVSLTPASAGHGEWTGTVPANTEPNTPLRFEVSAVTSVNGQVVENESANTTIDVGALTIQGFGITDTPPTCELVNYVYFTAGSVIAGCLEVGASYFGGFTAVSGLPITVAYWNGTAHVAPTGAPTSLTSNATGEAAFTFVANAPPFTRYSLTSGLDALNFTVSVPGAGTLYQWTAWSNDSWTLYESSAAGVVQLSLDHTTYYAGATATATWAVSSTNLTKTGPLTAVGWIVTGEAGNTYEEGVLNSTGTSGAFTFPILEAMVAQSITATVYVANATATFGGSAYATVLNPSLLLTPASYYYDAGSSTSVAVTLNGGGTGAIIQFQAWEYWAAPDYALLANGTVANGSSIPLSIPSTAPPLSVVVDAWATVGGQVVASNTVAILLAQGYSIELGVSTVSSYSDGSFQPGQTVTLTYQVTSVGGAALPQVVSFDLFALGYPYFQTLQNVGPSGSVPFTIPSNAPQGTIVVELLATGALSDGTCFPTGTPCSGVVAVYVNPSPSVLNLELGAGSGITVGWLILLVLVAVIAVVLFLVIRSRGGRGPKPSPTPSSSSAAAPPEEWKAPTQETPAPEPPAPEPTAAPAPASSDSSPPPLPPPAGKA